MSKLYREDKVTDIKLILDENLTFKQMCKVLQVNETFRILESIIKGMEEDTDIKEMMEMVSQLGVKLEEVEDWPNIRGGREPKEGDDEETGLLNDLSDEVETKDIKLDITGENDTSSQRINDNRDKLRKSQERLDTEGIMEESDIDPSRPVSRKDKQKIMPNMKDQDDLDGNKQILS